MGGGGRGGWKGEGRVEEGRVEGRYMRHYIGVVGWGMKRWGAEGGGKIKRGNLFYAFFPYKR